MTVSNLLQDQGYRVVCVRQAEDALEEIKHTLPDLFLIDIKLPGLDGFDFFKEVRNKKEYQKIPFVFLTAFNDLRAKQYAQKLGAAEYITKPFDFEYLVTRIKELSPPR